MCNDLLNILKVNGQKQTQKNTMVTKKQTSFSLEKLKPGKLYKN